MKESLYQYLGQVADFPKKGITFQDIFPLLRVKHKEVIEAMSSLFSKEEWMQIDAIVGIESRGFIFASALAYLHNKGLVVARKHGKLPNVTGRKSYALEYGEAILEMQQGSGKVLIVDDLIATGGSMTACAALCEDVGYQVQAMACFIDLQLVSSFHYQGIEMRSVLQIEE
jgi:adenine phosphoribosyltransferase